MTSISNTAHRSPLTRLQAELTTEVQAGTIKSSDQNALSNALTSIDSSLQAGRSAGTGSAPPSPSDIQSKIGSLIDGQVSSGNLTSDQATELKQLFAKAAPDKGKGPGGSGGPGGPGGPGGAGGPPPPSSGDSSDGSSTSTSSTTSDSSSDLLANFLKQLQASLSQGYNADGSTSSSTSSLLFNVSA